MGGGLNLEYNSGSGGGGGASSFSELSGDPRDNAALDAELDATEQAAKDYADSTSFINAIIFG